MLELRRTLAPWGPQRLAHHVSSWTDMLLTELLGRIYTCRKKKNTDSGHVPLQRRSHIFEKITDRWNVTTSSKLSPVDANGDESQPLSRRASSTNPDLTDDARNANPSHHLFWSQKSKGTPGESSKGCRIAEIAEEKLKENPRKRTIYPLAAAKTASNIGQIIKLGDKPKIRAVPS